MRPRVLMVICQFPPRVLGGAEKMAETFARVFRTRDWLSGVVTSAPTTQAAPSHPNLPVDTLTYPAMRVAGSVVYLFRLAAYLVRKRHSYDVIYLGLPKYEVMLCTVLGRLLGKALVVKFESATWERQENPVFRIRGFAFYQWALRRASAVVVLSEAMKNDLVGQGVMPGNVHVIPNAVDTKRFRPVPGRQVEKTGFGGDEPKLVVFLGRLVEAKGIHELLEAFHILVQRDASARLLILGQGPEEDKLRHLIRKRGLEHRVVIEATDNPASILPSADLFVLPSYSEGVSCALLEAMACGVCAVTTPVGGSLEVVRDDETGRFVPVRDANTLAVVLEELLGDEEARRRLGQAGRATVLERYDLERLADRYSLLFDRLTQATTRPREPLYHPATEIKTKGVHP